MKIKISLKDIIQGPILTEKALADQTLGKYHLWVHPSATKGQISYACQQIFSVKPLSVNTITQKGKEKFNLRTRKTVQKPLRKRALVTLKKTDKIKELIIKEK
jgi:large subunit ribosomal protein L23